ncbi:uncharacterized protein LOC132616012 [Lycium barbarum]|uniref:uncharacterized protein LOC132616012 n=1 Tax=Lycium barbarum TaxID=112863 RepID=UPI00293F2576|nr:uncharacterized protein LOC132616012 [Lycium barbarum]
MERISYARVLVEMDITTPLPNIVRVMDPSGTTFDQQISYEWKPQYCPTCYQIGHVCPPKQNMQAPTKQVAQGPAKTKQNPPTKTKKPPQEQTKQNPQPHNRKSDQPKQVQNRDEHKQVQVWKNRQEQVPADLRPKGIPESSHSPAGEQTQEEGGWTEAEGKAVAKSPLTSPPVEQLETTNCFNQLEENPLQQMIQNAFALAEKGHSSKGVGLHSPNYQSISK